MTLYPALRGKEPAHSGGWHVYPNAQMEGLVPIWMEPKSGRTTVVLIPYQVQSSQCDWFEKATGPGVDARPSEYLVCVRDRSSWESSGKLGHDAGPKLAPAYKPGWLGDSGLNTGQL